jgi:DNA gyrase/topoisomerase IV subunit B
MVDGELEADRVFSELMGKDPAARYEFIMEQAPQAEAVELDV